MNWEDLDEALYQLGMLIKFLFEKSGATDEEFKEWLKKEEEVK